MQEKVTGHSIRKLGFWSQVSVEQLCDVRQVSSFLGGSSEGMVKEKECFLTWKMGFTQMNSEMYRISLLKRSCHRITTRSLHPHFYLLPAS